MRGRVVQPRSPGTSAARPPSAGPCVRALLATSAPVARAQSVGASAGAAGLGCGLAAGTFVGALFDDAFAVALPVAFSAGPGEAVDVGVGADAGRSHGGQRVEHAREHGWHHRHEQAEADHHHDQPDDGAHEPRGEGAPSHDDEGSTRSQIDAGCPDRQRCLAGRGDEPVSPGRQPARWRPGVRDRSWWTGSRSWHGSRPALPSRGRARRAGRSTTPPAWRSGRPRRLAPSAGHRTRLPGCRPGTTPA